MVQSPPPDALPDRVRWVLEECLVIVAIAAFWIAFALVAAGVIGALGSLLSVGGGLFEPAVRLLSEVAQNVEQLWLVVGALALATTALYVVVRAGTVLIDHRRRPPE
ncbi:hypothetical protein [Halolamina salifodinae]|uniref:Uncharacterized protein n=1 Tax=Halolamina salifodinae TaxID=1202767 RepID=A0A8T4H4T9_9EURY|nr:hypothetical protein [Halolamina salifodinae]MBP1988148.1 hypothetical protein [Halolamina salifodinae]